MSKILKGIGKVFRKVVKVAKVVLPIALAVGAVVLTGGAAAGILPSLGTMVGGLGLSAGLTTALTGAISTGAIGAVGGFLTGGVKGMTKGLLMGAATGGIMGAAGMLGPNGLIGGGKAVSSATSGLLPSSGALASSPLGLSGAAPQIAGVSISGAGATSAGLLPAVGGAAGSVGSAVAAGQVPLIAGPALGLSGAAPTISGATVAGSAMPSVAGLGGGLAQNPQLLSSLMGGVAQAFATNEYKQRYTAEQEAEQRSRYLAYGGGDVNGKKKGGMVAGVYSGQAQPFGTSNYGAPPAVSSPYTPRATRFVWDPATNSVIEKAA